MKKITVTWVVSLLTLIAVHAQDGKLISKQEFKLPDTVLKSLAAWFPDVPKEKIQSVRYSRITYLSDGLKVTGFMVEPAKPGKYPCIISNRGGNRDFGQWEPVRIGLLLGQLASWDYVVVASQYRGNDGSEGKEEFGGRDINDVLNLIHVLEQTPGADTSRMGIEGTSRGGMMTYLALKKTNKFKGAVVVGGMANAFTNIAARPAMEQNVFSQLVPDYWTTKENSLRERSAVFWADKLCKTTPLLIMHGSSDWRVSPAEALELVNKLYECKHPTRFILFEGADHGITEFRPERAAEMKRHFDYYVRDRKSPPNMIPHGS